MGKMYEVNMTHRGALDLIGDGKPVAYSYHFEKDMTSATLQAHLHGDLKENSLAYLSMFSWKEGMPNYFTGSFTLESAGEKNGRLWDRGSDWGFGRCSFPKLITQDILHLNFGDYSLVKIIDENGAKIEPAHQEFEKYMGNVSLFVWNGFRNATEIAECAKKFNETMNKTEEEAGD